MAAAGIAAAHVDQTGYAVSLARSPQRIVSLVPSQTELLFDLGLADRLVGCTRYCLHPREARERLTVVGGTKRIDPARVLELAPDLVIGNKEENDRESIEPLRAAVPTWLSDIATLPEALAMVEAVGDLAGAGELARELSRDVARRWAALPDAAGRQAAYLIWRKPWMAVACDTFIDDVLTRLGFCNVFADQSRYPETSLEDLADRRPDVVLLSSEPFPFDDRHVAELNEALPGVAVMLVDGEMFSWYGSRLRRSPAHFSSVVAALDAIDGERRAMP